MKKRGQINGCQQKRGKTQLLLWLNIRAIKGEEAFRDRLFWLCGICASILKKDMSAQNGFCLLAHTKDVFGQAEWKENSFQICIKFPFILYKRRTVVGEAAHKQLKAKKKKKKKHNQDTAQSLLKFHYWWPCL